MTAVAHDETRQVLERFGAALLALEAAIDRKAPIDEIGRLDAEVARRARELYDLTTRIRSRRIA